MNISNQTGTTRRQALQVLLCACAGKPLQCDSAGPRYLSFDRYTQAVESLFGSIQPASGEVRFRLRLTFIPSSSPASQIVFLRTAKGQASAQIFSARRMLGKVLEQQYKKTGQISPLKLTNEVKVDAPSITLQEADVRRIVTSLWNEVEKSLPALRASGDVNIFGEEMSVSLDGTQYLLHYEEGQTSFSIAMNDEEAIEKVTGRVPLAIWMNQIRLEFVRKRAQ